MSETDDEYTRRKMHEMLQRLQRQMDRAVERAERDAPPDTAMGRGKEIEPTGRVPEIEPNQALGLSVQPGGIPGTPAGDAQIKREQERGIEMTRAIVERGEQGLIPIREETETFFYNAPKDKYNQAREQREQEMKLERQAQEKRRNDRLEQSAGRHRAPEIEPTRLPGDKDQRDAVQAKLRDMGIPMELRAIRDLFDQTTATPEQFAANEQRLRDEERKRQARERGIDPRDKDPRQKGDE